jgi:hypothetical protein
MRVAVVGSRVGSIALAAVALAWVLRGPTPVPNHVAELPPWFGDVDRPATRVAGHVFGATNVVTVHLLLDVPPPQLWTWRETRTSSSGDFDFGPVRAGRYRLFADGNGWLSRVVGINTMREAGDRTELFARELSSVIARFEDTEQTDREGLSDDEWDKAHRLSTVPFRPYSVPFTPMVGFVVRADGTPAASVGVQPIECLHSDHSWPHGLDIVATTSAGGGFSFVPDDTVCGLRILMGPITHEVELEPRATGPLVVQLPPSGREQTGVFETRRRSDGDPQGAWLRGRIVRDGVPAGDVDVSAFVLPRDNLEIYDETRSRSDGTFELFVSSRDLETVPVVSLVALHGWEPLRGQQVIGLSPGEQRNGIEVEIGPGVIVSGTLLDGGAELVVRARAPLFGSQR